MTFGSIRERLGMQGTVLPMTDDARRRLREMLERFVRGDDQSLRFTNEIEILVRTQFKDAEFYEELSYDLATYSLGGGDHLIDEKKLAREFSFILAGPLADPPEDPPN
ncbi:MAG: hypothetical protein DMD68_13425 [Gemmatimonadetes bacterium]|nr:MAG: hypothetical protein DMD68_13425 [Gemmatimonadota bacterium]